MSGIRGVSDQDKSLHQFGDDHYITYHPVPFAAGATRSAIADLDGKAPIRIIVPSSYSATRGQYIRVRVGLTTTSLSQLWVDGTAFVVPVRRSREVAVDPTKFWGVRYIQLLSSEAKGTASTQHESQVMLVARVL